MLDLDGDQCMDSEFVADCPLVTEDELDGTACSTGKFRDEFSGAGAQYGLGHSLMDVFNADEYAQHQETNLYYPFALKHDWEIATFLDSSKLSMADIDKFLGLELVNIHALHALPYLIGLHF